MDAWLTRSPGRRRAKVEVRGARMAAGEGRFCEACGVALGACGGLLGRATGQPAAWYCDMGCLRVDGGVLLGEDGGVPIPSRKAPGRTTIDAIELLSLLSGTAGGVVAPDEGGGDGGVGLLRRHRVLSGSESCVLLRGCANAAAAAPWGAAKPHANAAAAGPPGAADAAAAVAALPGLIDTLHARPLARLWLRVLEGTRELPDFVRAAAAVRRLGANLDALSRIFGANGRLMVPRERLRAGGINERPALPGVPSATKKRDTKARLVELEAPWPAKLTRDNPHLHIVPLPPSRRIAAVRPPKRVAVSSGGKSGKSGALSIAEYIASMVRNGKGVTDTDETGGAVEVRQSEGGAEALDWITADLTPEGLPLATPPPLPLPAVRLRPAPAAWRVPRRVRQAVEQMAAEETRTQFDAMLPQGDAEANAQLPLACPLRFLKECQDDTCSCYRQRAPGVRAAFEEDVVIKVRDSMAEGFFGRRRHGKSAGDASQPLVYATVGCGSLYFDYRMVSRLCHESLSIGTACIIDTVYASGGTECRASQQLADFWPGITLMRFSSLRDYSYACARCEALKCHVFMQCDAADAASEVMQHRAKVCREGALHCELANNGRGGVPSIGDFFRFTGADESFMRA